MKSFIQKTWKPVLCILMLSTMHQNTEACTRVVYQGLDNTVLTARSMDWKSDIRSNLWIMPRGIKRTGAVGPASVTWTSRYGSVIASAYDMSSSDGMNEKGLAGGLLWLAESKYPAWDQKQPAISLSLWLQYVLDNFATVAEAVEELEKEKFSIVTAEMPGMTFVANIHLCISDKNGDNAIFEYIDGKLIIHHGKQYTVMTNSPTFDKQLAITEYWQEIGGINMLPGSNRAADRFARASFYINALPKTADIQVALAGAFSVIRNCSVPFGISTPNQPNISTTRWRTVSDHKNEIYYFESALTLNMFWVDLKSVDFSEKATIKKLTLTNNEVYAGNAADKFISAPPFTFAGLK